MTTAAGERIASVAAHARTAAEADLMVALLRAEGIPATTEGSALADEVAITRRAMHLTGLKVLVPTPLLEEAHAVLAPTTVDEHELVAQALAATPEPACTPYAAAPVLGTLPGPRTMRRMSALLLLPWLLALLVTAAGALSGLLGLLGR